MNKEIWKDVIGYAGIYLVSNFGNIKRVAPARGTTVGYIFKPCPDKKGYLRTRLTNDKGKSKTIKIHRIVCAAFNENPSMLPQVNHKDGNKLNNNASNLEWCDGDYNTDHKVRNGLTSKVHLGKFGKDHNRSIPIRATNIDTGEVREIIGINEASRSLKTNSTAIWRVLSGEWKHTKRWNFIRL